MNFKKLALILPFFFYLIIQAQTVHATSCSVPSTIQQPDLYSIGWLPWLGDLKSWRNYDPKTIQNVGRLIPSPDGSMVGEPLAGSPTCQYLEPGEYTFVMKWQDNEIQRDYIENTDVIYLLQKIEPGPDYIRHSQLAGGFSVFCAGTFKVESIGTWPFNQYRLSQVNEVLEITNFSGHYKPKCKCLGVLEEKFQSLKINTTKATTKFMGKVEDCKNNGPQKLDKKKGEL